MLLNLHIKSPNETSQQIHQITFVNITASANIGAAVVGAHGLRSLSSKQALAWRPISARLQLLTDLVGEEEYIIADDLQNCVLFYLYD